MTNDKSTKRKTQSEKHKAKNEKFSHFAGLGVE